MVRVQLRETDRERISWARLKKRVLHRDGHRCRNCASEKYLEVHHWRPLPEVSDGIDHRGYRTDGPRLIVPESGLITLCTICHNALTQARKIVRTSENPLLLEPVSVQEGEWHNIFQLWELNGRSLPMKVIRKGWYPSPSHYYLIEKIEIRKWPFGLAFGRYHRDGNAKDQEQIRTAGTYSWKRISDGE